MAFIPIHEYEKELVRLRQAIRAAKALLMSPVIDDKEARRKTRILLGAASVVTTISHRLSEKEKEYEATEVGK